MADLSLQAESAFANDIPYSFGTLLAAICEREQEIQKLALDVQSRFTRVFEMARLIDRESDDLPVDCEPSRIRICAEVIREAAELAAAEAEGIEAACTAIRQAMNARRA